MENFIKALMWQRKQDVLPPQLPSHEVYQVSTVSALLEGVYDGDVTYGQVMKHGDFGVGTFNGLDGEMLAVHGVFYQITSDGNVRAVSPTQKTPFAAVMFFRPSVELKIDGPCNYEQFQNQIDQQLESKNEFYAIRAEGFCEYLKLRTIPKQNEPYLPIAEVVQQQREVEHKGVHGLLAGFRFPSFTDKLDEPGYHLHFIDETRSFGGHVLEAVLKEMTVSIDHTSKFHLVLPEEGDFLQADFSKDDKSGLYQ